MDINRHYLLGIDIGGTNLKAGIVSPQGELVAHTSRPTCLSGGWEGVVGQVEEAAKDLLWQGGLDWSAVKGLGVGVPGTVRLPEGQVLFAPNLKWERVPLLSTLAGRFPVPVRVDNDAHVAALGEYWRGAARGYKNVLLLTLGTGVGSALLLEGRVLRGRNGLGNEMGHMVVDPHGPPCGCGNRGCLEAFVAVPALQRLARDLLNTGKTSSLAQAGDWGVREIFAAAAAQDAVGQLVVASLVKHLAIGLANAVVLVDPEVILLGGGVSQGADVFLPSLREEVAMRVGRMAYRPPPILPAALGNRAGILGAAYLVRDEAGEDNETKN